MFATLKTRWKFRNGKDRSFVYREAGRYEIERKPNPVFADKGRWLVFKGTEIGAAEGWWREWAGPEWDEMQIIIEE